MNNTHCFMPLSPTSFLDRAARAYPTRDAIISREGRLTYAGLNKRAIDVKLSLKELGVKNGDCVGLIGENSADGIASHFGIPAVGAILVSLNPWLSSDILSRQISFTEMKVILVSRCELRKRRSLFSELADKLTIVVLGNHETLVEQGHRYIKNFSIHPPLERQLDCGLKNEMDAIALNFTSGTTGEPKGVIYSHRAAYLHAMGQVFMLGLQNDSRYLWSLPMFHVNGWGHMWAAVAAGATQIVDDVHTSPIEDEITMAIQDYGITHLSGSPRLLATINLETLNERVRGALTVMTGGATPPRSLIKKMSSHGVNFIHQYGLNETCGPFVVCETQDHWRTLDSDTYAEHIARQGVPGMHASGGVKVVDLESGQSVPWDGVSVGEIAMSGNTVALGYYKNLEATASSFRDGWFWSGDLGVVHGNGYIEVVDRIKDLIHVDTVYGWENVSSLEIEKVILSSNLVRDVAVIGFSTLSGRKEIAAIVECEERVHDLRERLSEYCAEVLPAFKIPSEIVEAVLPKTATGKVQKGELRRNFDVFLCKNSELDSVVTEVME